MLPETLPGNDVSENSRAGEKSGVAEGEPVTYNPAVYSSEEIDRILGGFAPRVAFEKLGGFTF